MANKPQGVKAPKSEKSRRASYIDETLKKLLTKHWEFQNKYLLEKRYINPNNYVFISERNVGPSGIVKAANISSLYTWLKRFTRKNGLSQVGPHAFRHMGATYALMEGVL